MSRRRRFVRLIEKSLGLSDEVVGLVRAVHEERRRASEFASRVHRTEVEFDQFVIDVLRALRSEAEPGEDGIALSLHVAKETVRSLDEKQKTIDMMRTYLKRAARELGKDFEQDAKKEGLI